MTAGSDIEAQGASQGLEEGLLREKRIPGAVRQQLRLLNRAWMLGTVWTYAISGAAMAQYALAVGMPDYAFGILAALPFLATFMQLPGSYLLERYGHRRTIVLWSFTLGRLMWICAAAMPWIFYNQPDIWWKLLIVLVGLAWTGEQVGQPAATSWNADLIPSRVRGRFVGRSRVLTRGVALLVSVGIGYVLDVAQQPGQIAASTGVDPPPVAWGAFELFSQPILMICSVILAVGGLFGVLDIQMYRRMDPGRYKPDPHVRDIVRMLGRPFGDARFRRFLAFIFVFNLAVGFIGQYIWLYFLTVLRLDNWQANMLLLVVPLMVHLTTYGLWGRLVDKLGRKPVLVITTTMMISGAFGWLLAEPGVAWPGIWPAFFVALLGMIAWPGFEIANFNIILGFAGTSRRMGRKPGQPPSSHNPAGGSAYVAANSLAVAVGGVLSGIIAALIARQFSGFEAHWLGRTWGYHHLLLAGSTVLRLVAVGLAMSIDEPTSVATRDALRFMTISFYSNLRQAATVSTRAIGSVVRWSYRINRT